jgi:hypothetical protein
MTIALLDRVAGDLRGMLAGLDPERLTGPDADRLLDRFAEVERLAAAGKLLAARRVESSNSWRRGGHRTAAAHVAQVTGTGLGPAINTLKTARRLGSLPATDKAVRDGALSEEQAREIAGAAALVPEAEQELVDAAGKQPMNVLKLRCRRVRATADDQAQRYDRLRSNRYLRHWTDDQGAVRFDARLTPDDGARVVEAIRAEAARQGREAARSGSREPADAHAADALLTLTAGQLSDPAGSGEPDGRGRPGPGTMVHVRVDHAALVRGRVDPGEICEIPGIGPIPVAVARRLASDAILSVLVTDGVDVLAVGHAGRTIPAAIRRALTERDPVCVVPGCDATEALEIDHIVPIVDGGETALANLARLCRWHHYLKTHHGHRLRRVGAEWDWRPPDEPDGLHAEADPGAGAGGNAGLSGTGPPGLFSGTRGSPSG